MTTTAALRHARRCAKTLFARTAARANTAASRASIEAFMEKFDAAKTSPTMDRPSTPTTFASAPIEDGAKGAADKLKLNFYLPHEVAHDKEEVRERSETRWDDDRRDGVAADECEALGCKVERRERERATTGADRAASARGDRAMVGRWRAASDDARSRSDD